MIQLHKTGVLARVPPDEIAMRRLLPRIERVQELALRRRQAQPHVRKLVVDESRIEARDKRARERSGADE